MTTLDTYLVDPVKRGRLRTTVQVTEDGHSLSVGFDGYGECTAEDGFGTPILIELYEGQLRLLVWGDINSEDPTHVIPLTSAQECLRKETL